jgi:hypothetical protein
VRMFLAETQIAEFAKPTPPGRPQAAQGAIQVFRDVVRYAHRLPANKCWMGTNSERAG